MVRFEDRRLSVRPVGTEHLLGVGEVAEDLLDRAISLAVDQVEDDFINCDINSFVGMEMLILLNLVDGELDLLD